jgi:hypothetical protein
VGQPFNEAILTNSGKKLINKALESGETIEFVCLAVGDGYYSEAEKSVEKLQKRDDLKKKRNEYGFSDKVRNTDDSFKLTASITNQDQHTKDSLIDEGYYINEIGIFAKIKGDEDSILYSIAVTSGTQGDYIPPFNGSNFVQIIQDYIMYISNDVNVQVQVNPATCVLMETFNREMGDVKDDISNHKNNDDVHITPEERSIWNEAQKNVQADYNETNESSDAFIKNKPDALPASDVYDWAKQEEKPTYTQDEVGLGKVDNTADMDKPVSTAVQNMMDVYYQQLTAYSDTSIANLINGAPTTLDTLGELADAMEENQSVVEALDEAIGKKANAAEFDSHESNDVIHITAAEREYWNGLETGDTKSNTISFTSSDAADSSVTASTGWTTVTKLTSGLTHANLFARVSQMFKNVRYLYKLLGTEDISAIGDGTVRGALSSLNSNSVGNVTWISEITSVICTLEKTGNIVTLSAYFNTFTLPAQWSNKKIGQLPSGFYPKSNHATGVSLINDGNAKIIITTTGEIQMQNVSTTTSTGYFGFTIAYGS